MEAAGRVCGLWLGLLIVLLADRTNGRAIATLLRLSVCLSVTLCIMAKRCVLEQKLLLRDLTLNILETVRDRGLIPKDYQ